MAITDEDTILVLGAGVSAPFGLPLGGHLITSIAEQLELELTELHKEASFPGDAQRKLVDAARYNDAFLRFPVLSAITHEHVNLETGDLNNLDEVKQQIDSAKRLVGLLNNQTSEAIDDFIVENPSYSHIAKIGIASSMFELCYDIAKLDVSPKSFSSRYVNSERNWVHLLINIIRQGIRNGSVSKRNTIKIVTFNYDMILEHILEEQFSNTEAGYPRYTDFIEIIHVHGQCGPLKKEGVLPAKDCASWAHGIHVVNEQPVPQEVASNRSRANELIKHARALYFCGFSFSGPNCRLLGLGEPYYKLKNRAIHACNYDGNIGISMKIEEYEHCLVQNPNNSVLLEFNTDIREAKGTPDRPLSVSDWLQLGYLGELPG